MKSSVLKICLALIIVYVTLIAWMFIWTVVAKPLVELTPSNTVVLRGPVDWASVQQVQIELQKRQEQPGDIYLILDTPGGSVADGLELIEYMETLSKKPKCIALFAASMGAMILEHCEKRYTTMTGTIMFHRASGGMSGQFAEGELESRLALWTSIMNQLSERVAERLGMNLQEFKAKIVNEWWIHGKEAEKQGIVDDILGIRCSKTLVESRSTQVIQTPFGLVELKYSGCPLFRKPLQE